MPAPPVHLTLSIRGLTAPQVPNRAGWRAHQHSLLHGRHCIACMQGWQPTPPTAGIAYGLQLPLDLPAAERLTCGLTAYFLDEPQLQPLAEQAAAPQAGIEAEQGPTAGPLACCRAEVGSAPHPLASGMANGDPLYHGTRAEPGTPLDGISPAPCGCDTQDDAALHGDHRLEPGQPGVVVGESSACGSNDRWTAHAALVLNAPAAAACTGTERMQEPGSAPAPSAAASAAQHVPDDGSDMPRPVAPGPGLQDGMQEPPGASGEPAPCAAGSARICIYLFESWTPLQRPAGPLAKALCDGALWGAFGISIMARPCLCSAKSAAEHVQSSVSW